MTHDESKDDPASGNTGEEGAPDAEEPDPDDGADSARAALGHAAFGPVLPAGFAQSLLPSLNRNLLAEAFRSSGRFKPSTAAPSIRYTSPMQRLTDQLRAQPAEVFRAINPLRAITEGFEAQRRSMLSRLVDPRRILRDLQRSIAPYTKAFAQLPRPLLPPNLREVSDHITAHEVLDFLEEEGIPLYLIPRAAIGKRLVLSKDHANRRKVLNDRFNDIVDDCVELLDTCTDPIVGTEVHFIQDGIGALRAGHHASAQALFTVALDTLISRFYPDREKRKKITNRKKDSQMPDEISHMGIRDAYVWLPVWNAHQEFWHHKGDRIPNDYSRHATVHGVSRTQFNKRNCVQALMLASSLVGYANQLARARRQ